jgi:hypothetical protein
VAGHDPLVRARFTRHGGETSGTDQATPVEVTDLTRPTR